MNKCIVLLFTVITAALYSTSAWAQSSATKKILIVKPAACCPDLEWRFATRAFLKEVQSLDVIVETAPDDDTTTLDPRDKLMRISKSADADVVLQLRSRDNVGGARILLWNRRGQAVLRSLRFENIDDPESRSNAVLQIVEVALAGLMEMPTPVAPPKKSKRVEVPQSPAPVEKADSSRATHLFGTHHIGLRPVVLLAGSPGGIGPQFGTGGALLIIPNKYWSIALEGIFVPVAKDIDRNNMSATIDMAFIRGFTYFSIPSRTRIHPMLGLGGGTAVAWTKQKNYSTRAKDWVGYVGASLYFNIAVAKAFSFVVGGNIGILVPSFKIYFDDETAATYGRPVSEVYTGFEVSFL